MSAVVAAGLSAAPESASAFLEDPRGHARDIGHWSDGLWSRYGADDVGGTYAAYLNEVCPAYPGWDDLPLATDLIGQTLEAAHGACREVDEQRAVPLPEPDCVVIGERDPIAPAALAGSWGADDRRTIVSQSSDHWLDDASACLALTKAAP